LTVGASGRSGRRRCCSPVAAAAGRAANRRAANAGTASQSGERARPRPLPVEHPALRVRPAGHRGPARGQWRSDAAAGGESVLAADRAPGACQGRRSGAGPCGDPRRVGLSARRRLAEGRSRPDATDARHRQGASVSPTASIRRATSAPERPTCGCCSTASTACRWRWRRTTPARGRSCDTATRSRRMPRPAAMWRAFSATTATQRLRRRRCRIRLWRGAAAGRRRAGAVSPDPDSLALTRRAHRAPRPSRKACLSPRRWTMRAATRAAAATCGQRAARCRLPDELPARDARKKMARQAGTGQAG
jgi:hypothetical protein